MNELVKHNEIARQEVIHLRDGVRARRASTPIPALSGHSLRQLRDRLSAIFVDEFERSDIEWSMDPVDRAKFGADFAVRLTTLMSEFGAKNYVGNQAPRIVAALERGELKELVAQVTQKGIYVNVRLRDEWFLQNVADIIDGGYLFGQNDFLAGRAHLVDYSSPNVAKVLHAGHFRSTVIGHVLSNVYQACGSTVYRVNHINDFGGFGFMLEGYRRFADLFPPEFSENARLLEIYAIRRALETAARTGLSDLGDREREIIARYFPNVHDNATTKAAFTEFSAAADRRFEHLEDGDADEVELWRKMVACSLADFASFYSALDIHIDFVIGESFYITAGNDLIDAAIAQNVAYVFTPEHIRTETATLDEAVRREEITQAQRDRAVEMLTKDLGAAVVPLPGGERLVVRRSDGRSIYATRDVGAIKVRREIFDPTDMVYVVGQEQQVHFSRLFEAAQVLGLAESDKPRFKHIYFGFYVDAETGRKLSSRESVAGVTELLAASVTHFRERSAESGNMTPEELDQAAQQLAVGSIIFNDLRRDMKAPVSIPRGEVAPIIAEFEKAGGPYVVYSACRARAILRRYGKPVPRLDEVSIFDISDQEASLIWSLMELPEKVVRAAEDENPAVLIRHLLAVSGIYNSYYASAPVLSDAGPNLARLMITRAVQLVLTNGLRMCHIECPSKI